MCEISVYKWSYYDQPCLCALQQITNYTLDKYKTEEPPNPFVKNEKCLSQQVNTEQARPYISMFLVNPSRRQTLGVTPVVYEMPKLGNTAGFKTEKHEHRKETTHVLPLFLVHLGSDSIHIPGEDPKLGCVGVQWSRSCGCLPLHVSHGHVCGLAVFPPSWPCRSCQ